MNGKTEFTRRRGDKKTGLFNRKGRIEHRNKICGVRRYGWMRTDVTDCLKASYDGVRRTARPTNLGSWALSCSKRNREFLMNRKKSVLISDDLRGLTPHPYSLSPLRGEGGAIGSHSNLFGLRHSYDGVRRTTRPANFGSWPMSRSEREHGTLHEPREMVERSPSPLSSPQGEDESSPNTRKKCVH